MLQSSHFTEASSGVKYDKGKKRTSRSWLSYARGIHARFLPGLRHAQMDIAAGTHAASIKSVERKDVTSQITEVIFETLREDARKGFEIPESLRSPSSSDDGGRYNISQALSFIYRLADALSTGKTELVCGEVLREIPRTYTVNGSVIMRRYPGRTCLDVATLLWRDLRHAQQYAQNDRINLPEASRNRYAQYFWVDSKLPKFDQIIFPATHKYGVKSSILDWAYYDLVHNSDFRGPDIGKLLLWKLQGFLGEIGPDPSSMNLVIKLGPKAPSFVYERFDIEAKKLLQRLSDASLSDNLQRANDSTMSHSKIWIGFYLLQQGDFKTLDWHDPFHFVRLFDKRKNPEYVCLVPWENTLRTNKSEESEKGIFRVPNNDDPYSTSSNEDTRKIATPSLKAGTLSKSKKIQEGSVSRLTSHLNAPLLAAKITKPEDATTWGIRLDAKEGLQIPSQ